ncbi:MAG: DNA recombination protein RmuC [Planctomycetes bacterium]|nr:DNA recombination protein RmuC [Planctomycetota bacterium]
MDVVLITILVILLTAILGMLVWLLKSHAAAGRDIAGQSVATSLLQQQLEAIRTSQDTSTQNLEKNLQTGQQSIGKVLESSRETLNKLHTQIGQLQGTSQQMVQLGTDVRSLQDILKNPKLRGQLGEKSLEKVLSEVLPADSFTLQHGFKNGKIVDALAKMPDYSVPIDAKFPLPGFQAMIKAQTDDERARLRRQFQGDVIKHIDKIAANYINPDEGTLDFALMYIPAENVYYETIIKYDSDKKDIAAYAMEKKIIPVSPNLLYAYLMTIVMGLHGLQIEKQAGQIRQNLRKIAAGFTAFTENWSVLGRHLRNAQNQYDEGQTKLDKFTIQLERIQDESQENELTTNDS